MPASTAAISSRESGRLMSIPETSPTNTGWIWRMDTFMCRLPSPCRLDYNDAVPFGIFVEEMRQGAGQRAAFRDVFELAERGEAWGTACVWLGEIHFTPPRWVISAAPQVASAIATRPRRLRVGTAVQVLPLNHPLRIAEEVATVDHISEGRFEFGIGRSGVVRTYDIYGVPYGESQARFREALEIIREGWKGEPFSYAGEFYRVQNAIVTPRPYQVPHPPFAWPPPATRRFPRPAGWDCPSSSACASRRSPIFRRSSRPTGRPGARPAIPASPACICASRSTPRPRRRAPWRSLVRASRPSSRARPSWPGPRSDGRAPAPPTAAGSRPSAWPASRTRTSSPGRWRSAPRAA